MNFVMEQNVASPISQSDFAGREGRLSSVAALCLSNLTAEKKRLNGYAGILFSLLRAL